MRSVRLLVPPTLALSLITVVHTAASWAHDPPDKHALDNNGNAGGSGGSGGAGGAAGNGGAGADDQPARTDCGGRRIVNGTVVELGAGCC